MAGHPTSSGRLTGVGVGPGDPMLLTRQAMAILTDVDRVVAPTTGPADAGRAETIVRAALGAIEITRLAFDMTPDGAGGADARASSHLAAARSLLPMLEGGEHVAFITLGDPNLYSTFSALVDALGRLGWRGEVSTVPGITAFQALAARTGTVLLDGTESLALVTALDGPEHLAAALEDPDRAVVVYKGGRHLPAIAQLLAQHGRLEGAVFGERLGLEGERVGRLVDLAEGPAAYLATVIVPPAPRPTTRDST
ncbi:MAG TPA: precorrin-2 C(20)-methyltransferase [Acidimicrobiales bacterium]|nr:precorrin-2 C(20)-methyltransferase [Acidimicrobiales bacterium]